MIPDVGVLKSLELCDGQARVAKALLVRVCNGAIQQAINLLPVVVLRTQANALVLVQWRRPILWKLDGKRVGTGFWKEE